MACSASAADYFTGQAARAIIGQRTFTDQLPGPSQWLLGGVSGVAYANGILVAVDDNRLQATPQDSRVLIFRDLSSRLPGPKDEIPVTAYFDVRCPLCLQGADTVLGQPNFDTSNVGTSEILFNQPTHVATDGKILVVADTNNNRVLIWKSIPTVSNVPADIVLGQSDFKGSASNERRGNTPTNRAFRGPQGVWIQGTRLFVADTQNNRVMIWRNIPTQNFQPADVVLGQKDFNTFVQTDLTKANLDARADSMLNPVYVSSDGQRLFVADLAHNRVLIWNSIPDTNAAPADVVVGQPDFVSATSNNVKALCQPTGDKDSSGNNIYPGRCKATMDFPRAVISDGTRLYIADGGNDRVLVFNKIPTQNGQGADAILGQTNETQNQSSDGGNPDGRASTDSIRTPSGLAWDGANLYVSEPYSRRIMIFTPGDLSVPYNAVKNAGSLAVYAIGTVTLAGQVKEGDEVTITIKGTAYKYKVVKDDTFTEVVAGLVKAINSSNNNAGDPNVLALGNPTFLQVVLSSRIPGEGGNSVDYSTSTSDGAVITATTGGANLQGGGDAAKIAPGTLISIRSNDGTTLADIDSPIEVALDKSGVDILPWELGGVQVYFDGLRAPIYYVSKNEIRAEVPFEVNDATSISTYVRTKGRDGQVRFSSAIAVPIVPANPGIFTRCSPDQCPDPRPGDVRHYSSYATGTVLVDGTANKGDTATITIEDRPYPYTVVDGDTLDNIRDGLIALINANPDEKVTAFAGGVFSRVRLKAKVPGPDGNGIAISQSVSSNAQVILTTTNSALCCANTAGAPVTAENPALPGETIVLTATGLGLVEPDDAKFATTTGAKFMGPVINRPVAAQFVSSLAGGKTANVMLTALKPGTINLYEVQLELNSDIPTNPETQLTIAQDIYVSNIITFPVSNPNDQAGGNSPAQTPTSARKSNSALPSKQKR